MVVGSLDNRGTRRHLLQVLPRLNRARFAPEAFALVRRGRLASDMEAARVPVVSPRVKGGRNRDPVLIAARLVLVTVQLWLHLLFARPAAAHMCLPARYLLGMPAASLALVRTRITSRRSRNHYQRSRRLAGWRARRWHGHARAGIGNSKRVMRDLLEDENVPAELTALMYNGVEPPTRVASRETVTTSFDLSGESLVIAIVANLIRYKGHTDLIETCASVATQFPPGWRLLIIGRDDGLGAALSIQADAAGIAENGLFLGERADARDLLGAADPGVLASQEEGFSNARLVLMAAGPPAVATGVGGNAEAVIGGSCGFIVPPRAPTTLGSAPATLSAAPELRAQFGVAARQRVDEHFTVARCVAAYESLYNAALDRVPLRNVGAPFSDLPPANGATS